MNIERIILAVIILSLVGMFVAIGAFLTLLENLARVLQ